MVFLCTTFWADPPTTFLIALHMNGCAGYTNIMNRQITYNVPLSGVRVTILTVEKAVSVTSYECLFIVSVIQHASACAPLQGHLWPVYVHRNFFYVIPITGRILE